MANFGGAEKFHRRLFDVWRRSRAFAAAFERRKSFVHLFDSEKWGNRGAHGSELPFSAQIKQQSAKHKVSFRFSIPKSRRIELHMAVNLSFLAQNKQQPANKKTIRLSLQNPSNVLKYKIAKFVM